jgi:hypothetical protein
VLFKGAAAQLLGNGGLQLVQFRNAAALGIEKMR